MFRRVAYLAVLVSVGLTLAGCGALSLFNHFVPRAPWRDAEEKACMADRTQLAAVTYTKVPKINGAGSCGIYAPLKVSALSNGTVSVSPNPTIGCPLTAALNDWMTKSVQPAAIAWFGVPVVEIQQFDAYDCRPVDDIPGENLSEHSFGNAIDVAGYKLADGRTITVKADFLRGEAHAKGFLHEIFAAACAEFKTVLGPGYPEHDDHFHLDLAHQNADGTLHYCNPKPDVTPPQRPLYGGPQVATGPIVSGIRAILGLDQRTTGSINPTALPPN